MDAPRDQEREDQQDAAARHVQQREADGEACLEAARFYLSLGWSVLALCPPDHVGMDKYHVENCENPGKRPIGKWKRYQDELPTEEELRAKWAEHPTANVGMALGPASGLVRIDVEGPKGELALQEMSKGDLPPTVEFKSGRSDGTGRGLLYKIPPGVNLRTASEAHGKKQELRFQGRGAQTVLPPSRHIEGGIYAWKDGHSPGQMEAALAPAWLVAELASKPDGGKRKSGKKFDDILHGVEEGSRNESAASFIGRLLIGVANINNSTVVNLQWQLAQLWNKQNRPPLPEEELRSVFTSILRSERERRDRLEQGKLDAYITEQVDASLKKQSEAKATANATDAGAAPPGSDGEQFAEEGDSPKPPLPDWHLVIVESDPREFRLRSPLWSASERLRDGYIVLNEYQIRSWNSSRQGIPQAAFSQGLAIVDPVCKDWAKPGGPLEKLTSQATIIEVAPENKRKLYILGFFYRYIRGALPANDQKDGSVNWPPSGRPTVRDDEAICFKLAHLKNTIGQCRE
ncbi:MAG TPA: bifunctional DNA primase/polymerase, partial [Gemmataceae bacterium]|nr:bifunctional DNA primase/polymerase [Gemmataceae bacterium]